LVHVVAKEQGGVPPFESVRAKVATDAVRAIGDERQQAALNQIVGGYRIELSRDLQALP
jgi:hypothetical protein